MRRSSIDIGRCWVAEPPFSSRRLRYIATSNQETLKNAFTSQTRLRASMVRAGSVLWRKYSASSPRKLDEARRKGSAVFPELADIANGYAQLFPRKVSDSPQVRLSEVDTVFLGLFRDARWLCPARSIKPSLMQVFDLLGSDCFFLQRLRQWANHEADDPILLRRDEPKGVSAWTKVSYQLSPRGRRILINRLDRIGDAPPMHVGGCRVYSGKRPWVLFLQDENWHIDRLEV